MKDFSDMQRSELLKEERQDEVVTTIRIPDGEYLIVLPNASSDYIQKRLAMEHCPYELEMLQEMQRRLGAGDLVLDIGANVGNHALFLAAIAGCKVRAFEPNESLCQALRRSVAENGLHDRVEVEQIALGREAASGHFLEELPENIGAQRIESGSGNIPIQTLDAILFDQPVKAIKVDVEGMELDVLEGGRDLLLRDRPDLYVECQREEDFRSVAGWLEQVGYRYWSTYNATPTHLFLPRESVTLEQHVAQLQVLEARNRYKAVQELRDVRKQLFEARRESASLKKDFTKADKARAQLQTERDDLHARLAEANGRYRKVVEEVTTLKQRVQKLSKQQSKTDELAAKLAKSEGQRSAAQQQLNALYSSPSWQLIHQVREGFTSFSGLVRLPVRLWRISRLVWNRRTNRQPLPNRNQSLGGVRVQKRRPTTTEPTARAIRLQLHEKLTELDAMRQLADVAPRARIFRGSAGSVNLTIRHQATEESEILIPWLGEGQAVDRGAILKVHHVRVEGSGIQKDDAAFLRSLGLANSERAGWYRYARAANSGCLSIDLQATPLDLEIDATLEAWDVEDFLTDLSRVRFVRRPKTSSAVEPFSPSIFSKINATPVANLRVGAIADPMTASALQQTVDVRFLDRRSAIDQIADWRPDLLFVESAWRGNEDQWRYGVGHYPGGSNGDLFRLIYGARSLTIPSVFWNKEDPIHFSKFAAAAALFDHVVTTDTDCIPRYRELSAGAGVPQTIASMPFFVLPEVHNPFYRPDQRTGVCFAGSFYGDRHPERSSVQEAMLDAFSGLNLDIYDRNHGSPASPYTYPARFERYIRGGVPYEQMPTIYKSYEWFLNVNTVTDSPTMYSRRVPELLACGTGVVTNPCMGIRETFQKGVYEWRSGSPVDKILKSPGDVRERLSAAIDTLFNHSFEGRLADLATRILGADYVTGWREFVLVLVCGDQCQRDQDWLQVLGSLSGAGVRPEHVVLISDDETLHESLPDMRESTSVPVTCISRSAVGVLNELTEKDVGMIVATLAADISPDNIKSLLCANRVMPAMVTGMSPSTPSSTTGLATQLLTESGGKLVGPLHFRFQGITAAVDMLRAGSLRDRELDAPRAGLTWSVAPRFANESEA